MISRAKELRMKSIARESNDQYRREQIAWEWLVRPIIRRCVDIEDNEIRIKADVRLSPENARKLLEILSEKL